MIPKVVFSLLKRHFWVDGLSATALTDAHLPDLATFEGLRHVLSLINIIELTNVLHPHTYRESGVDLLERLELIRCRSLARTIRRVLDARFRILRGPGESQTVWDYSTAYLEWQAAILQSVRPQEQSAAVETQILGCIGRPPRLYLSSATGSFVPADMNITVDVLDTPAAPVPGLSSLILLYSPLMFTTRWKSKPARPTMISRGRLAYNINEYVPFPHLRTQT